MHTRQIDTKLLMAEIGHRISDTKRLQILNVCMRDRMDDTHERTQRRVTFLRSIRECNEHGSVAVVWSGMDCDCVKYSGEVRIVEASLQAVCAHIDSVYDSADGTCSFTIEKPSSAEKIEYTSRDLAFEAYENDHPHHITC